MSSPLLQTKLNVPAPRPEHVPRPRLLAALDDGLQGPLAVLAAPAGYGKTTLLAQWLATLERPVAWLSLDPDDDDPRRFFTYLAAAVGPAVGNATNLLGLLEEGAQPHALATAFLRDVARAQDPFLLVLDDYHQIEATPLHDAVAFIVDHARPGFHLLLSGRRRPPLPLARLRLSGKLALLGVDDLRLTKAETVTFLQEGMALDLSEEQATALAVRCEGWVAALQMAALALRALQRPAHSHSAQSVDDFIARFSGNHHHVTSYLLEQVLERQPQSTRAFLRQTAILERFNGDLCNAVTGRSDGHELLARLFRDNLFLVPLDQEHYWYRYHHLFADLLARRLRQRATVPEALLHGRACDWFAARGLDQEAMRHALAAADKERAAALIVQFGQSMWTENRPGQLLQWLESLPQPLRAERPYLGLLYAWALWFSGRWSEVAGALATAKRVLQKEPLQKEPLQREPLTEGAPPLTVLRGMAALLEGNLALLQGEPALAVRRAEQAARHLPPGDRAWACMVAQCRGDGRRLQGDLVAAAAAYEDALQSGQAVGNRYAALTAARYLGEMEYARGHLHRAAATYRRALRLAIQMKAEQLPATANIRIWYSKLFLDWFELEAAQEQLETAVTISQAVEYGLGLITGYVELARVCRLRGDFDGARRLLRKARSVAGRYGHEAMRRHIAAVRAELYLAQAGVDEKALAAASHWARERRLAPDREWSAVNQTALTYASLLLAEGRPQAAQTVLRRLYRLASGAGRLGEQIQVRVLQVRAEAARGEAERAVTFLREALALAEPETLLRPFVAEGPSLLPLLQRLEAAGLPEAVAAFAVRVERTAAGMLLRRQAHTKGTSSEARRKAPSSPSLPHFTPRQWDVLRLLGRGLTNREIADELVVAESTVKTHLNHIYRKLDVHGRTEALARLQQILLP